MNDRFPPAMPPDISPLAVGANVVLLLLALAAAFGLLRRKGLLPRSDLAIRWAIVVVLVSGVSAALLAFEETRIYTGLSFALVWVVVGPTTLISLLTQFRGNIPTIRFVAGCLALFALVVFFGLPGISIAKQAAWLSKCRLSLQEIGQDDLTIRKEPGDSPMRLNPGTPVQSWRTVRYLARQSNVPKHDLQKSWNDDTNRALGRLSVDRYRCPADFEPTDDAVRYYTAYAAVTGSTTAFPEGRTLTLEEFTDGASNTIAFGEAAGLRIVWTEPRDIDIEKQPIGINLPDSRRGHSPGTLSSYHPGNRGATVVMADGSVRFLSERIDPAILKALLTATGGESLPDPY